ncbi:MAG TPA: VWA domain-containing protein, partial [Aestuariivirgaceae bacterium]|nr:VWA domain-containing protein [Aestuariivirgaceae bacterium]
LDIEVLPQPQPEEKAKAAPPFDSASGDLRARFSARHDEAADAESLVDAIPYVADRVVGQPATEPAPAPSIAQSVLPAEEFHKQAMGGVGAVESDRLVLGYHDQGRDKFQDLTPNPVKVVATEPVSTFSIDVDTSSYSFVRAALNQNVLPQADAVRVEEMINYFPYDYAAPADRAEPFRATATVFPTPWNSKTRLLHIGIKGYSLPTGEKPRSNLVFLIDTSGSMDEPNKLPLLVNSMKLLVDTLRPDDTVSIVTYAGNAGTVLEPTRVGDRMRIMAALEGLQSAGSTAGAEGIRQAYQLAERSFDRAGVNRVILATDGDFNVGITDPEELKSFVERKRATGIYLSVLGFGRGNYNDELMQTLAQNGNGNAAYIDTLNEARKVLVDEAGSTLFPIAKDVKIQVEFNPQTVSEYRLVGYETRLLEREDFNNDKVDAGEIGSGHTVTAIYEMTPRGSDGRLVDDLRYGETASKTAASGEYAFLKLRYKLPDADASRLMTIPVTPANEADPARLSDDVGFSAAVAAFGQLLRGGRYTGSYTYDDVIALGQRYRGADPFGYRAEFLNLARIAKSAQALEPLPQ